MAANESTERGKRSRWGSFLLAVVTIGILLVVGEVVCRVFFPIRYSMDIQYINDGFVRLRLEPNHKYRLANGGTCTINNLGFRGAKDTSVEKPEGTVRVVVLGGSAVFCYEVDDSLAWTALLEKKLQEEYGDHVEVINAGVPGYDAFVSKMNYLYRIRPLDPDIVVVSHTWNDLKMLYEEETGVFPDATIGPGPNPIRKFFRHFQLAWRIRAIYWELFRGDQRENKCESTVSDEITITPNGPGHRWARHNFEDLALLLQEDGVVAVFASQAGLLSPENVGDPAVRKVVRNDYACMTVEEVLKQWQALTKIIETAAWENGLTYVDVYDQVPHELRCFHDHVHLTEDGNRYVADAVYQGMITDPVVDAALRGVAR